MNFRISLCLVCCSFLISSISSCEDRRTQQIVKRFTDEEIIVPKGIRQMVAGLDSVALDPVIGVARLVVYVDSVTCSSCRLSMMYQYDEMINYRDMTKGKFYPIFVFSPPRAKMEEVILSLKYVLFNYPVFIDETGAFAAENPHIPTDSRFHTFLLDKNGKVVLVGDPVNNPALWELYKTTISQLIENDGVMPIVEK